ncbi:MAG: chorismate synthase [Clostridia bacterium]|nr:chorismate synthase [Clostridia bacterium]
MRNTIGNNLSVTLFGESHGEMIGAVIDGMTPGVAVDTDYIRRSLEKRRPSGKISTPRVEADEFNIVSGVIDGKTTGTPITILIKNTNTKSADYSKLFDTPRPSHADFAAECKYHGFQDRRGGGHFSGRITAALVAAGALIQSALEKAGIYIGTHIKELRGTSDIDFTDYSEDIKRLRNSSFPTLTEATEEKMRSLIEKTAKEGDSVGGILETAVIGLPAGVGEPWFDTVESCLAHILFSVPAIKGVEFGAGFAFADMTGSEANDPFVTDGERIYTETNNNGGINGGITNGMPLIFRCAVKPTPSIFKAQRTVSLSEMKNTELSLTGRHDPAIIHRAAVVIDSVTALTLADLLLTRYGTDWLYVEK